MQFLKCFCLFLFLCKVVIVGVFVASVFLVSWAVVYGSVDSDIVIAVLMVSFFLSVCILYTFTKSPLECFGDETKIDKGVGDVGDQST